MLALSLLGIGLTGCGSDPDPGALIVRVPDDQPSISAALDTVREGGLILIGPGRYHESVTVDVPDVTLRGTDRNDVVIDADGKHIDGVRVVADGVRLQNFTVVNAVANGVIINGADGMATSERYGDATLEDIPLLDRFEVSHVTASNNGLYGIYAFHSSNGTIRDTYTSGSSDAGLYVGQCDACHIVVEGNVAERNAVGFENANATDVLVVGNRFVGNRVGLTLTTNFQEAFAPQQSNIVLGNLIAGNNEPMTPEQAQGGFGIGVGLAGAQDNHIIRNRIEGNRSAGIVLDNIEDVPSRGNQLVGNVFHDNRLDVADIAGDRAPSAEHCRLDEPEREVGDDLGAEVCRSSTQVVADGDAVPRIDVPAGIPYFEVTGGPPQPTIGGALEAAPDPLPARPADVDLAPIAVPDRALLADRAAIRL